MSKQELVKSISNITNNYNMGTITLNDCIGQIRWEIEFYDLCTNNKERLETFK